MSTVRENLLALFNNRRAAIGVPALSLHSTLNQGADRYAEIMAAQNWFSHTRPSGLQWYEWWDRYYPESLDYPAEHIGEIIARGQDTTTEVYNAWMASSSHRALIEKSAFRKVGIGLEHASNGTPYWCVHFCS